MKELIEALQDYHTRTQGMARIPEFVGRLKDIKNLSDYVNNQLSQDQLEGKEPILSVIRPDESSPVRFDLYWNSKAKQLDVDWDDANPYKKQRVAVIGVDY